MHLPLIAPSVLSANFGHLNDDIAMINGSTADWVHCDIMDGNFVPNYSFGLPVLRAIQKVSTKPLDVHLMVVQPERYIDAFVDAGAAVLSVHVEASVHLDRTLNAIKAKGIRAGVAINPSTPIDALRDVLYCTDVVCLMSVNPGFGGQSFIENTYAKVRRLRQLIHEAKAQTLIEIDGGVTLANAQALVEAGADVLVAGNTVFSAADPVATIAALKATAPRPHLA